MEAGRGLGGLRLVALHRDFAVLADGWGDCTPRAVDCNSVN